MVDLCSADALQDPASRLVCSSAFPQRRTFVSSFASAAVRTASAGSCVVFVAAQSVVARTRSMKALNQVMAGLACATVDVGRHQVAKVTDVVEFLGMVPSLDFVSSEVQCRLVSFCSH